MKDIPKHIAIIMDGNSRWAKKNGLPRFRGHKKGSEVVETIIEKAGDIGVKVLTFYAFSTENWNRSKEEVKFLMDLLYQYLKGPVVKRMINNNVRLNFIGDMSAFSGKLKKAIDSVIDNTKDNDGVVANIALNYGSRDEIVNAVNHIIKDGLKQVDKETFSKYLYTKEFADPDLLIRTSGEFRISNFLLWQIAYSEIYVTETYWPDFDEVELLKAIDEYQKRDRRYGGRNE